MSDRAKGCWPVIVLAGLLVGVGAAQSPKYEVGRAPTADEVKAWSITIFPDGNGLPDGSGTAAKGKEVYARRCSECHGTTGQGGESSALVGGKGSLVSAKPLKTVGSYWPYATSLWDYVNRTMPFHNPGILTDDQVYSVVAYVLHLNEIVGENDEMNRETLPDVRMPNRDGFVKDDRPDVGPTSHEQ